MYIDPGNLSFYINDGMSRYYTYLKYQLLRPIVHSVSLNNKLTTCFYLRLPGSVNSAALTEYEPKQAPIVVKGMSGVVLQNCNCFCLSK